MIAHVPEDCVRHIGRTGRAGAQESAVLWLHPNPALIGISPGTSVSSGD